MLSESEETEPVLDSNIFRGLVNLRHLIINSDIDLKRLAIDTFKSLVNLETVDLRGCAVSEIDPDAFSCLQNLRNLDLSKNSLTSFSMSQMPVNLEHLNLSFNMFDSIEDVFKNKTDKINSKLTTLGLSDSRIKSLPANSFPGLQALRSLDLSGNWLSETSDEAFKGLVNLRKLDLSNTRIRTINAGLFSETPKLKDLNLLQVNIESFEENVFVHLRSVLVVEVERKCSTQKLLKPFEENKKLEFF
jgi:Leucine-rich repeat (LRR) protein